MTPLAPHLTAFFRDRLPQERQASENTCRAYAYAFMLLLTFAAKRLNTSPSALFLEQLDAPLVLAFLKHLETARNNSARSRNGRLAAIRAFARFVEYRVPSCVDQMRRILAIPQKKTDERLVPYLTPDEVQALLDGPDPTRREGIRDRAMLHLAYAAGLRVSELIGLQLADLTLGGHPSIHVRGKGRRERALPLWKETATALRAWLAVRGDVACTELFVNSRGEPLSRWGIEYLLTKYVKIASVRHPSLTRKRVSPHVLRHTCAMHTLQSTRDIRRVALWLGHAHVHTTEIYVRADPTEKLEAIEALVPPRLRRGRFHAPERLIAMLNPKTRP